jgi:nitrogen fixation NifU-like protein
MEKFYTQKILVHYRRPRNHGLLPKSTFRLIGVNPSCGDHVAITLLLDAKERVKAVGWEGRGCVISQAACSILSEEILGMTLNKVKKLKSNDFLKNLDVQLSPTRIKCALLSLMTLQDKLVE